MKNNADDYVYFGRKLPTGQEANWIPTVAGNAWFSQLFAARIPLNTGRECP